MNELETNNIQDISMLQKEIAIKIYKSIPDNMPDSNYQLLLSMLIQELSRALADSLIDVVS